jgi:hypothetical protein
MPSEPIAMMRSTWSSGISAGSSLPEPYGLDRLNDVDDPVAVGNGLVAGEIEYPRKRPVLAVIR